MQALVLAALAGAALANGPCTRDALFTALSREGRAFCSSVVEGRCHAPAPTQLAGADASAVASQCSCVLAETCRDAPGASMPRATETPTGRRPETSTWAPASTVPGSATRTAPEGSATRTAPEGSTRRGFDTAEPTGTRGTQRGPRQDPSSPDGGSPSTGTGGRSNSSTAADPGGASTPSATRGPDPGFTSAWNSSTTAAPTSVSPPRSGSPARSPTSAGNSTAASAPTTPVALPAANFTQVARAGAAAEPSCYHLPADPVHGDTRTAALDNAALNASIPFPNIEAIHFGADGVDPLFLRLRDATNGTHYLDVSNGSRVAIVDSLGNAMLLDARGIHFSTNSCRLDVSIAVDNLYAQLAALSGEECAKGAALARRAAAAAEAEADFNQTLVLRDQCGDPVGPAIRRYPRLRVGNAECPAVAVDGAHGEWVFGCPGAGSGGARCRAAVRRAVAKFLFVAPFGGACPDLSTVVSTLETTSADFLNAASLKARLAGAGAAPADAERAVMYYEQLWELLKQALSKLRSQPPGGASAIEQYLAEYNGARRFDDVCDALHARDAPLPMALAAGVTRLDGLAVPGRAPGRPPPPLNVTVQDPARKACCRPASVAARGPGNGTCAYPASALLGASGCVCGRTAAGDALTFAYAEYANFAGRCDADADCRGGFVCLTGSCCGGGVCVDPYECSQNGTDLIPPAA